jgi:hypothetical protein
MPSGSSTAYLISHGPASRVYWFVTVVCCRNELGPSRTPYVLIAVEIDLQTNERRILGFYLEPLIVRVRSRRGVESWVVALHGVTCVVIFWTTALAGARRVRPNLTLIAFSTGRSNCT